MQIIIGFCAGSWVGGYAWFDLGNEKTEYKLNPRKEMEATVKSVEGICRLPQDRGMWADVMSRGSYP